MPFISTYIFVRNDLHVLDVASGLKDLAQHILGHPLVQSADIQCPFVGLRSCSSETTSAGRGHHATVVPSQDRRGHGGRDGVRVLRNMEGRRGEMSWVSLAILGSVEASAGLCGVRWSSRVGHHCDVIRGLLDFVVEVCNLWVAV